MAATVNTEVWKGGSDGSPTYSNMPGGDPNLRFKGSADNPDTIDTNNPCEIPTSGSQGYKTTGFNYSYWVHSGLNWTGLGTSISNFRHYSDGAIGWNFGTAGELRRGNRDSGDEGCTAAEYDVATGVTNGDGTKSGDDIEDGTDGHGYYNGQTTKTTDIESDTSGSPATIDSSNYSSDGRCYAVVLQVKIDDDATQGDQTSETLTWLYDEI